MSVQFRISVALFIVFLSLHWQAKAMICKCNDWYQKSRMELREFIEQNPDYDEEGDGLAMSMSDCDSKNECEVLKIYLITPTYLINILTINLITL